MSTDDIKKDAETVKEADKKEENKKDGKGGGKGFPKGAFIAIVVLALAVIGLVAFIIGDKTGKKKKSDDNTTKVENTTEATTDNTTEKATDATTTAGTEKDTTEATTEEPTTTQEPTDEPEVTTESTEEIIYSYVGSVTINWPESLEGFSSVYAEIYQGDAQAVVYDSGEELDSSSFPLQLAIVEDEDTGFAEGAAVVHVWFGDEEVTYNVVLSAEPAD